MHPSVHLHPQPISGIIAFDPSISSSLANP